MNQRQLRSMRPPAEDSDRNDSGLDESGLDESGLDDSRLVESGSVPNPSRSSRSRFIALTVLGSHLTHGGHGHRKRSV